MKYRYLTLIPFALSVSACSSDDDDDGGKKTDAQYSDEAVSAMHGSLLKDLDNLVQAAEDMQKAAPKPTEDGWDAERDAAAITATKAAWSHAREAYEHIEGALAPLFPSIDASIDFRYDDFLESLAPDGDQNLFDGEGVTGMHAAERVLYAPEIPATVIEFESTLTGYKAAAYPATEPEARDFKEKLLGRIVADAKSLRDQWTPQNIDLPGAFDGLKSLMSEQQEKINKASSNEEESRYSQRTMADLRDNLEGTRKIYAVFRPWLLTKKNADEEKSGVHIDQEISAGFDKLDRLYDTVDGDAIPAPPDTWSAEEPSAADLKSPFGKLYTGVSEAVVEDTEGSVVNEMNEAYEVLGFPEPEAEE